jgi:hypothetical protein
MTSNDGNQVRQITEDTESGILKTQSQSEGNKDLAKRIDTVSGLSGLDSKSMNSKDGEEPKRRATPQRYRKRSFDPMNRTHNVNCDQIEDRLNKTCQEFMKIKVEHN